MLAMQTCQILLNHVLEVCKSIISKLNEQNFILHAVVSVKSTVKEWSRKL